MRITSLPNILLSLSLPASPLAVQGEGSSFHDVPAEAWYSPYVERALSAGLMNGLNENVFGPDVLLTRGQTAQIIFNSMNRPSYPRSDFPDTGDQWYAEAASFCRAEKIMTGYEDGSFGGDDLVSRQDFMTTLYRLSKRNQDLPVSEYSLDDYLDEDQVAGYASDSMNWGISSGMIGSRIELRPQAAASRAEAAKMLVTWKEAMEDLASPRPDSATLRQVRTYLENARFVSTSRKSPVKEIAFEDGFARFSLSSGEEDENLSYDLSGFSRNGLSFQGTITFQVEEDDQEISLSLVLEPVLASDHSISGVSIKLSAKEKASVSFLDREMELESPDTSLYGDVIRKKEQKKELKEKNIQYRQFRQEVESTPLPSRMSSRELSEMKALALDTDTAWLLDQYNPQEFDEAYYQRIRSISSFDNRYSITLRNLWQIPYDYIWRLEEDWDLFDFTMSYLDQDSYHVHPDRISQSLESIPLLIQWDLDWAWYPYGNLNVAWAGCAPTSISMIFSWLLQDPGITPWKVAQRAEEKGLYIIGAGSSNAIFSVMANEYGLGCSPIGISQSSVESALLNGQPVILNMGPGIFTRSGHFIVVTGMEDGKWTINDPNSIQRSQVPWEPHTLISQCKAAWTFWK